MCCGLSNYYYNYFKEETQSWIRDYNNIQWLAVHLIHAQIFFSLIGSLGAFYTALLLAEFALSLFALVAIESSSLTLARTYAILLFFSILLDIAWFFLFSNDIWRLSSETYGDYVRFSVKLTLTMQIVGFFVRSLSSLLWIQMYRMGVSSTGNLISRETDSYLRNSFLSPSVVRRSAGSGDMYDPLRYSTLLEDGRDDTFSDGVCQNHGISVGDTTSASETSRLNSPLGRTCRAKDDEYSVGNLQIV